MQAKDKTAQPDQGNDADPASETYEDMIARLAATVRLVEWTPEGMKGYVAKLDATNPIFSGAEKLDAIAKALGVSLLTREAREERLRRLAAIQGLHLERVPSYTSEPDRYRFTETVSSYMTSQAEAEAWLKENACTIRSRYIELFDDTDWGENNFWKEEHTLSEAEARLSKQAAAEGLLLRAFDGEAYDVLLDPEVCVDPDGRQWLLRNADLEEVPDWFAMWDRIRRESAATEAKLARLIPAELRNDAEGINADGEDDGRGAPSTPWEADEGTASGA